ncbi:sortase A [Nonomuraea maritima]|uniref:Sortase A n=2 Tax=Nonomuraea maritima TaxID=683260 RepID=A0A1G9J3P3_9ACTN|nr:sortase A [Nonomuraea maritima]
MAIPGGRVLAEYPDRVRVMLRAVGEVSVTAGLILMLFCAYLLWGTGSYTRSQQLLLQRELAEKKAAATAGHLDRIELGAAVALLRIPRLGRDYEYAVVEGVGHEELKKGPGHHPATAMPGAIGNFVVSGHRTTYAAPFNRIDELERGDEIIVEAREARYVYRVTSQDVVLPDEVEVLAPVPGKPDIRPIRAFITLLTCHPEYSAAERLIVYGVLKDTVPRKE